MLMRPTLLAVLLAATLAGCSGDPGDDDPTGDLQLRDEDFNDLGLKADADTGILRGVVIDEAIRPLADVVVTALGGDANVTMTTADDGLFGFDGLRPGTYFVTVAKAGYVPAQTSAEVVAGDDDPAAVKLLMTADPTMRPYVQPYHLDGFIGCSVRPMFIAYQCPGVTNANLVNENYELERTPQWIQSEMVWESTQATGDELSLVVNCLPDEDPAERCQEGQMTIVRDEGFSPRTITINETVAANWTLGGPDGNPLSVSVFVFGRSDLDVWDEEVIYDAQKPATGNDCLHWPQVNGYPFAPGTCMRATGPGFVLNQKIDIYTHVFYGYTPPEGWTLVEDGAPPAPPA